MSGSKGDEPSTWGLKRGYCVSQLASSYALVCTLAYQRLCAAGIATLLVNAGPKVHSLE